MNNDPSLQELMEQLNIALTEKQEKWVHDYFPFEKAIENFVFDDPIYYLADGGYSRIGWNKQCNKLFLASESLEKPKMHWNDSNVVHIRKQVERRIKNWLLFFE